MIEVLEDNNLTQDLSLMSAILGRRLSVMLEAENLIVLEEKFAS